MRAYDPKRIRIRDGWVVVLMDQRQEVLDSGIVLPFEVGAEKVTEGAGTIFRVGLGEKNEMLGLQNGQRICLRSYLKYANAIPNEERWADGRPKEYFILNVDDILAVMDDGVRVGVFSRPAMGAVENIDDSGKVRMRR